jgi:hypothetical protein
MYFVALIIVTEKTKIKLNPIRQTIVMSIGGVFIIRNYYICSENPMLKITPKIMPSRRLTINRMIISKKIIILIFYALSPIALSILYISASSLHFPIVYRKMNIVTNTLITHVISTTYMLKYFYNNKKDLLTKSISNICVCSGDIETIDVPMPFRLYTVPFIKSFSFYLA